MKETSNKILSRIYGHGRGWVFSHVDFADLGSRSTIDWRLHDLVQKGTIRRIIRGIYEYPKESTLLKETLPAEIPKVAQAIARKFNLEIQPSGDTALNLLGFSTQVPSKYVYITNGRSRSYRLQNRELHFKKGMLKETGFKLYESGLLVHALRALGKDHLTQKNLDIIRSAITPSKCKQILQDTRSVTGWIYKAIHEICRVSSNG